jgi:putative flippase GtrA
VSGLGSTLWRTWRILLKELGAFGVVGAVCFVLDLAVFQLLYAELGVGAVTAKLGAAAVSTTGAFLGHRFWSFSHRSHTQLHRDYVRFAIVNVGTLLISLGVVALVRYPLGQEGSLILQAANIASIALGTAIRFLAYRSWVFPARSVAPDPITPDPVTPAPITPEPITAEASPAR